MAHRLLFPRWRRWNKCNFKERNLFWFKNRSLDTCITYMMYSLHELVDPSFGGQRASERFQILGLMPYCSVSRCLRHRLSLRYTTPVCLADLNTPDLVPISETCSFPPCLLVSEHSLPQPFLPHAPELRATFPATLQPPVQRPSAGCPLSLSPHPASLPITSVLFSIPAPSPVEVTEPISPSPLP